MQCVTWAVGLGALALTPGLGRLAVGASVATVSAASALLLMAILGTWRRRADLVTLGRVMVAALACLGAALSPSVSWLAWAALLAAAFADLLDGRLARRDGPTEGGAVFDMECDQLVVLIMAVIARMEGVGAWVLLLPGYRYVYVGVLMALRVPAHDPKPRGGNLRGRLVCALVVTSLLVSLAPVVDAAIGTPALILAVLALGWSFGSDAVHLIGGRARTPESTV